MDERKDDKKFVVIMDENQDKNKKISTCQKVICIWIFVVFGIIIGILGFYLIGRSLYASNPKPNNEVHKLQQDLNDLKNDLLPKSIKETGKDCAKTHQRVPNEKIMTDDDQPPILLQAKKNIILEKEMSDEPILDSTIPGLVIARIGHDVHNLPKGIATLAESVVKNIHSDQDYLKQMVKPALENAGIRIADIFESIPEIELSPIIGKLPKIVDPAKKQFNSVVVNVADRLSDAFEHLAPEDFSTETLIKQIREFTENNNLLSKLAELEKQWEKVEGSAKNVDNLINSKLNDMMSDISKNNQTKNSAVESNKDKKIENSHLGEKLPDISHSNIQTANTDSIDSHIKDLKPNDSKVETRPAPLFELPIPPPKSDNLIKAMEMFLPKLDETDKIFEENDGEPKINGPQIIIPPKKSIHTIISPILHRIKP